jgi:hypothetical protein
VVSDLWLVVRKNSRLPEDLKAVAFLNETFCTDLIEEKSPGITLAISCPERFRRGH